MFYRPESESSRGIANSKGHPSNGSLNVQKMRNMFVFNGLRSFRP